MQNLRSWVPIPADSEFPLENLPYGVFAASPGEDHIGVAIGDYIFDLHEAANAGLFDGSIEDRGALTAPTLNDCLASGRSQWSAMRARLIELLSDNNPTNAERSRVESALTKRVDTIMRMPFAVSDYVDFYSSLEHATNMGKMLRPGGEPLLPNWKRLPIGYHGRASSVVIDGTPVLRPWGQWKAPNAEAPTFAPTESLDIELEMGFVTGGPTRLGRPISIGEARDHIFGLVIVNDWSARDIQAWEYQPLGPFLGKSFATSISPWVVTLDALEPYRCGGPRQDPVPLAYLRQTEDLSYDIELRIMLQSVTMRERHIEPVSIASANFKAMYWTMAQQLAHLTSNGARILAGGLYASGTISGEKPDSYGSLMELTWRGTRPLKLPSGEERGFLEDGDTVIMRACAHIEGSLRIGFGEVRGTILPAPTMEMA